jgi:hypothetical protein
MTATRHPAEPPPETEPAIDRNPEPVRIADVIQAFRDHPDRFIADAYPDPPEAA